MNRLDFLGKRLAKNKGSKSVSRFFQDRPGEGLQKQRDRKRGYRNAERKTKQDQK